MSGESRRPEAAGSAVPSPRVSLVVPAFREEERLPRYFPGLVAALADLPVEIIVVDDGSPTQSHAALRAALEPLLASGGRLLRSEVNRGKGAAIAFGLEHAAAEYVGFVDADGSIPASEVRRLVQRALGEAPPDMIAGSRVKMLGRSISRSPLRHFLGRIFATALAVGFKVPVYDSQCGLKLFRADRYRAVRPLLADERWTWDTQLLILFHGCGWSVEELPVDWHDVGGSKVRVLRDGLRMFASLARFRRRQRR